MANFGEILLDPLAETPADNFVYDPLTEQMKYIIDKWLFPNRLYYFSIRAIDRMILHVTVSGFPFRLQHL